MQDVGVEEDGVARLEVALHQRQSLPQLSRPLQIGAGLTGLLEVLQAAASGEGER